MRLSHEMPRMSKVMCEKVSAILEVGCWSCTHNGCDSTASLTRRIVAGNVTVYLQCDSCGSSLGSSLKRADHYYWQTYRTWDQEKVNAHQAAQQAAWSSIAEQRELDRETWRAGSEDRKQAYSAWLASSPEWANLRRRVLGRANRTCEACLDQQATQVHHLTYALGWLPPAWELRAVCDRCHQSIHAWPRAYAEQE
jgi:hypothetical protein